MCHYRELCSGAVSEGTHHLLAAVRDSQVLTKGRSHTQSTRYGLGI